MLTDLFGIEPALSLSARSRSTNRRRTTNDDIVTAKLAGNQVTHSYNATITNLRTGQKLHTRTDIAARTSLGRYSLEIAGIAVMIYATLGFGHIVYPSGVNADRVERSVLRIKWRAESYRAFCAFVIKREAKSAGCFAISPTLACQASRRVFFSPVMTSATSPLPYQADMDGIRERLAGALDPALPETDRALAALTRLLGVPYISMLARLCPAASCIVEPRPGVPLQFDYGHFTREGSETAVMLLAPDLRRLSRKEARP